MILEREDVLGLKMSCTVRGSGRKARRNPHGVRAEYEIGAGGWRDGSR